MIKKLILFIFISGVVFLQPTFILAAEVLQITNSSTLLVGDHNRTYTVKIACLEVQPSDEKAVIDFLGSTLPRRTKINLRPKGSEDGVLISSVIHLEKDNNVADQIISKGLAKSSC